MLAQPKYKAELEAIGKKVEATNQKIKRNLKFDDEGLQMWTLSMENGKFKEVVRERMETNQDFKDFVHKHDEVEAELKDMFHDVGEELSDIGDELEEFGDILDDPKYEPELKAIG